MDQLDIDKLITKQNDTDNQSDLISLIAINELSNPSELKRVSRVKIEQVPTIAKLYLYADTFNNDFTKSLADMILNLQVSINGLGRRELVQMVQRRNDQLEQVKIKPKEIFK